MLIFRSIILTVFLYSANAASVGTAEQKKSESYTITYSNGIKIYEPKFRKICDGLPGSEGPVFDTKGNFYVVSPNRKIVSNGLTKNDGRLHKISLETGQITDICTPSVDAFGGRPAGCQSDKFDNIWIADVRLGLLKYSPNSDECEMVSSKDINGNLLNGCNDLVFDTNGNLWITAPGSPVAPEPEDSRSAFTEVGGNLYFLEQGHTAPIPMNESFLFVNGIAVKDDLLLVAETMKRRIIAFDIASKGELANRRVWADLPEAVYNNPMKVGGPDGIDFDIQGRLLVTHHGSSHIEVFSANGTLEARIKCPFLKPSNLQFKPDSQTCYVTEHDSGGVWEFEWESKGRPMNYFS